MNKSHAPLGFGRIIPNGGKGTGSPRSRSALAGRGFLGSPAPFPFLSSVVRSLVEREEGRVGGFIPTWLGEGRFPSPLPHFYDNTELKKI